MERRSGIFLRRMIYGRKKKQNVLAVLRILLDETDASHILTRPQFNKILERKYNIFMDRRTFYSIIDMLKEFGYDISTYEENKKGYYLRERLFDFSEILWLCNAIHASVYIPERASKDLIHKLLSTQSRYDQKRYYAKAYLPNKTKIENKYPFYTEELLSDAIEYKKNVVFNYMEYNSDKKLVERHEGKTYNVEPRYIVHRDGRPYLVATNKELQGFYHYRIDLIRNIELGEEEVLPLEKSQDPYEYAKHRIFMYSDDLVPFQAICHVRLMGYMIEEFGKDVHTEKIDQEHFRLVASAPKRSIIWLAQQYMDGLEIVEPATLREEVRKKLAEGLAKYQK